MKRWQGMWLEWRGARTSWTSGMGRCREGVILASESQEKKWSKKARERVEMQDEELRSLRRE